MEYNWNADILGDTVRVTSRSTDSKGVRFNAGGDRTDPMILFKADDGKPEIIDRTTDQFNQEYQLVSKNTSSTINGKSNEKQFVTVIEGSFDLGKLIQHGIVANVTLAQLNAEINRINNDLSNSTSFTHAGWGDLAKYNNFDHGEQGDIKANGHLLNGMIFTHIEGVGLVTSDFVGNVVYGYVASAHQNLRTTFRDGDRLQRGGVDDPYDSYALLLGDIAGRNRIGLTVSSFSTSIYMKKTATASGHYWNIQYQTK